MDYESLPNLSQTFFLKEVYCNRFFFFVFFPQVLQSSLSSLFYTKKQFDNLLILALLFWTFPIFHEF